MSRFRMPEVPRDQALLFATRLDDAIPEGHPVRHVLSLLQSEQVRPVISRLATTYSEGRGQPAYHPLYLVALYIHGMLIGERSSRRMEQACHNRVDVMWLMEGQHPDHSTIAGFHKRWSEELRELLKAIVLVARDAGLVKLGLVAIDGTKVAADASKDSVKKKESLLRKKEAIDAKVKELEAEWESNEAREAVLDGDTPWTPPKGTPQEQRRQYEKEQEALDEALKAIERRKAEASRGGSRVAEVASITDPEARRMKGKGGEIRPNYNGQVAVDDEAGVVVAVDVNDLADDSSQLRPMVEKVEEVVGEKPKAVVADSGYNTGKDIADLESAGVTTYMPDCGKSGRGNDEKSQEALQALVNSQELSKEQLKALPMGHNGKLSNQVFTYNAETDTYRCPMGEELSYFKSTKDRVKGGSVERRM